jgi:hypothetical protein
MKASDLRNSPYMEEDDVTPPVILTIAAEELREFKKFGGGMENKAVLGFGETDKLFVCNITNFKHISKILGEKDSADWIGHKIEIWYNPDIEYQGDTVGGIRVRKPKNSIQQAAEEAQAAHRDRLANELADAEAAMGDD